MSSHSLSFSYREIGRWSVPTVEFNSSLPLICLPVVGRIENSTPNNDAEREALQAWKVTVASTVKVTRGADPWNSRDDYAISLGISFHNRKKLDIDNYSKPILDALAAGLFCDPETDPKDITRWSYPDSNFKTLLIHRLRDVDSREEEGIAICVSSLPA